MLSFITGNWLEKHPAKKTIGISGCYKADNVSEHSGGFSKHPGDISEHADSFKSLPFCVVDAHPESTGIRAFQAFFTILCCQRLPVSGTRPDEIPHRIMFSTKQLQLSPTDSRQAVSQTQTTGMGGK
ncbi:MAG: hypothetical protein QM270_11775 [Bacillota bacterium]|nr:hypothetical protein [Bacillota bacterium]